MDTKISIQEAAITLFAQYGYHTTSTRDIANKAKINSSMVNYYFQSKENLYVSIFELFKTDYLIQFDIDYSKLAPKEAFLFFIDTSVYFSKKHEKIMLLLYNEQICSANEKAKDIIFYLADYHFQLFLKLYKNSVDIILSESNDEIHWKYFTFFYNLKNYIICNSQLNEKYKVSNLSSGLKFLETSIQKIFLLNHSIVLKDCF